MCMWVKQKAILWKSGTRRLRRWWTSSTVLNYSSEQTHTHTHTHLLARLLLTLLFPHNRLNCTRQVQREDTCREMQSSLATVKGLLVQHSGTLWIGTRSGFILLVEISSCQLLQSISLKCHSMRCMDSVTLGTDQSLHTSCFQRPMKEDVLNMGP